MQDFTDVQLKAFITAISDRFSLGIKASDSPVRQHDRFLEFKGLMPRMRKEHTFVIPFERRDAGVIVGRSVLYGSEPSKMQWLLNGQASRNCKEAVYIGANSDNALSLHPSKEMLKEWTHGRLPEIPEDRKEDARRHFDATYEHHVGRGLFGDEVCIGSYEDDGEYLKLKLAPAVAAAEPEHEPAAFGQR